MDWCTCTIPLEKKRSMNDHRLNFILISNTKLTQHVVKIYECSVHENLLIVY